MTREDLTSAARMTWWPTCDGVRVGVRVRLNHGCLDAAAQMPPSCGLLMGDVARAEDAVLEVTVIQFVNLAVQQDGTDVWAVLETALATANMHCVDAMQPYVIGWYATCPGKGARLSRAALALHRRVCSERWQIGLVLDAQSGQAAIFQRDGAGLDVEPWRRFALPEMENNHG